MASADYRILKTALDKKTARLVVRVDVPNTNNAAGNNYRTALVESLGGAANIASEVPNWDDTALKNGSKLEYSEQFQFSILGLTVGQRRDEVEARVIEIVTNLGTAQDEVLQPVLDGLIYWQYANTVTV